MAEKKTVNIPPIVRQIAVVAHSLCGQYLLRGEPIAAEKAFGETKLLPAIMRRADQLCSFCLGYGLGLTFEKSDDGVLGVRVVFDDQVSTALRLLCATDVLIEIIQQASNPEQVPLDGLLQD